MRKRLGLAILACGVLASPVGAEEPFNFVALGDTTYAIPADNPLYEQLIAAINETEPAFSIHVGDTKGYGDCGREFQASQRMFFDSFSSAVFYAPGNNEWADCWKANRNSADPTEILAIVREVFFSEPRSMGARPLPMVRQSDEDEAFPEFAENARWEYGGTTFATLNMVGTFNNLELRVEKYWREAVRREEANVSWVKATFRAARKAGHRAVVLACHSNPFPEELRYFGGPFEAVLAAIIEEAADFSGQVLLVHGHNHEFIIDRPVTELSLEPPGSEHANVTRLQVYGWPDMKAVRVSVDVSKPWVFGFEPVWAEGSGLSTNSDLD
jgi:hypothetical protein